MNKLIFHRVLALASVHLLDWSGLKLPFQKNYGYIHLYLLLCAWN